MGFNSPLCDWVLNVWPWLVQIVTATFPGVIQGCVLSASYHTINTLADSTAVISFITNCLAMRSKPWHPGARTTTTNSTRPHQNQWDGNGVSSSRCTPGCLCPTESILSGLHLHTAWLKLPSLSPEWSFHWQKRLLKSVPVRFAH